MEAMGGREPRGPGSLMRRLEREAVKSARALAWSPRLIRALPAVAPPRTPLPQPWGIGRTAPPEPGSGYHGVAGLADYRNEHARDPGTACGPAAAASVLTHWGRGAPAEAPGVPVVRTLEERYPPTLLGTSPEQMGAGLRAEGLAGGGWVEGEALLRQALDRELPAIALLDVHAIGGGRTMHWVALAGYDAGHVHLTNWSGPHGDNRMTWAEFRTATTSWLTRGVHTAGRYLVVWP